MAGNHVSQLSPRQRMINMMYLVLTALLALNVSKKVLDSFFKVDEDLTHTILEKYTDNQQRYNDFAIKADKNPAKIGQWNDLAQELKKETKTTIDYIDSLRFELWRGAKPRDYKNKKKFFDFNDEKLSGILEQKSLYEMHYNWKKVPEIEDKANYAKSTKIMVDGIAKENISPQGVVLKNNLSDYRDYLLTMDIFPLSDSTLRNEISSTFSFPRDTIDDKDWEYAKFSRIPVVAVLTFLNQLALDVVNTEDKMLTLLEQKTGTSIVSIDRQIPYGLPKKSYLNTGDELEMSMLLMGIDTKTKPLYDLYELDPNLTNPVPGVQFGNPLPKGTKIEEIRTKNSKDSTETVEYKFVIDPAYKIQADINTNPDGMGEWSTKLRKRGKQWIGGVIRVVSDIEEDGYLEYPWATEIMVQSPMSVISASDLKVIYKGPPHTFKVAVPGYDPKNLTLKTDNKAVKISRSGNGTFVVTADGKSKSAKLWVTVKGRGRIGEAVEYDLKPLPKPTIRIDGKYGSKGYKLNSVRKFSKLRAKRDPSFVFPIEYQVKGFEVRIISSEGTEQKKIKGNSLGTLRGTIASLKKGDVMIFSQIKTNVFQNKKRIGEKDAEDLVITIK